MLICVAGQVLVTTVVDGVVEILDAVAANTVLERVAEVVLGCGPLLGEVGAGVDLERGVVGGNGVVEVPGAVAADTFSERVAEAVLGHGPVLGEVCAGIALERGVIGGDGVVEVLGAVAADTLSEGGAEVVLGHRPAMERGGLLLGDGHEGVGFGPLVGDRAGGCQRVGEETSRGLLLGDGREDVRSAVQLPPV